MRVLLGSGGFRTEERQRHLFETMRAFFGDVSSLLFVPWAVADHDGYLAVMKAKGFGAGYELRGLHREADPARAVAEAEAIYVGGGNTFRLTAELQRQRLLEPIRERARAGMPYMGVSAGSNVACPTMKTTNDMPITEPASFEALGLVPFQVNAHYYPGMIHVKVGDTYEEHYGETRDDRIAEFHELNDEAVVGLWEGAVLRVEGDRVLLSGDRARVFEKGRDPVDHEPGARLDELLRG
jgi:dipeptidase E